MYTSDSVRLILCSHDLINSQAIVFFFFFLLVLVCYLFLLNLIWNGFLLDILRLLTMKAQISLSFFQWRILILCAYCYCCLMQKVRLLSYCKSTDIVKDYLKQWQYDRKTPQMKMCSQTCLKVSLYKKVTCL